MDFKKFGTVVLILGILVFSYGGFQWISNQGIDMEHAYDQSDVNKAIKREYAIKELVAGGIVAFVGFGEEVGVRLKD